MSLADKEKLKRTAYVLASIDLNSAGINEFSKLRGVSDVDADLLTKYRAAKGSFTGDLSDLKKKLSASGAAKLDALVAAQPASTLVNINTADLTQLKTLPGVGDSLAQKIYDFIHTGSKKRCALYDLKELFKVDGVGAAVVNGLRGKVSLLGSDLVSERAREIAQGVLFCRICSNVSHCGLFLILLFPQ